MNEVSKINNQEVAEQVLQVYTKALQDHKQIKSILSEYCILDYFGKVFYEQEKVASQLVTNFHGSNYELTSISINDSECAIFDWYPAHGEDVNGEDCFEEDLGVGLISSPKLTFPSVSLSTPVRCLSPPSRKRSLSESSQQSFSGRKFFKVAHHNGEQSSSCCKKSVKADSSVFHKKLPVSPPQSFRPLLPEGLKHLTAYGTIRYSNRTLSSMDPKKMKQKSLVRLRDRFCQLHIGFECDEHAIGVTNCKIWTIKYSVSSRVTPRNLLNSFNEVD